MLAIAAKSIGSIAAIHITLSGICIANSALYQGKIMTSSKSKTDTQKKYISICCNDKTNRAINVQRTWNQP